MNDQAFREQLTTAAEVFPVRGWSPDLHRRVVRRRRVTAGLATAAAVLAVAGVTAALPVLSAPGPRPQRPAPPAVGSVSGDYLGSRWRLTEVVDGARPVAIPASVGAWLELLPSGQLAMDDGTNAITGSFTRTADGFVVRDAVSTAAGYAGRDPHRLAAIAGLRALIEPDQPGALPSRPSGDTVLNADGRRLVVQAGIVRLTFARTGPAAVAGSAGPPGAGTPS